MNAGKLRHRVRFEEPITSQDATGDEIVVWVPAFMVWASVEPLTGRERLLADQIVGEGETRIRIRWSTQAARITSKWRAVHRSVIYNIAGPPAERDMGHRELEIMATSGVNNA